jgi:hypothetical protein
MLLGKICESAPYFTKGAMKDKLVKRVAVIVEAADKSEGWNPRKTAEELILVLFHGLGPAKKSTRSQWKTALKAASKRNIARTQQDYFKFIETEGGLGGILNGDVSKDKRPSLSGSSVLVNFRERHKDDFGDHAAIEIPESLFVEDLPHELGLLLFQKESGSLARPITTLVDVDIIARAIKLHQKAAGKTQK